MSIVSEMQVAVRKVRAILGYKPARGVDREYYQRLHETPAYQTNNWLVDDLAFLRRQTNGTLIEIGCGNGRFLDAAAAYFTRLEACDWAVSPVLRDVLARHQNVRFHQCDITQDDLPLSGGDIVVSADVLEHLPPHRLPTALARIDALAPRAYHKIACYDDGHSHLSILPPDAWLRLFRACDPRYDLLRTEHRRGDGDQLVAVIGKNLRY
jgi:SAM-dependent methyltransferase